MQKYRLFCFRQSSFFLFKPLPYPTLAIEFHNNENTESDGDSSLKCSKTRVDGIRELVGDDVVARPKDAGTWHQRKDATDEEYSNWALPPCRLQ